MAGFLEALCNQYLPAANLSQLLPAVQQAAWDAGQKNFTTAFKSVVIGPPPAWFSNIPTEFQTPLQNIQAALGSLRTNVITNETAEHYSPSEQSSASAAYSSLMGTPNTTMGNPEVTGTLSAAYSSLTGTPNSTMGNSGATGTSSFTAGKESQAGSERNVVPAWEALGLVGVVLGLL